MYKNTTGLKIVFRLNCGCVVHFYCSYFTIYFAESQAEIEPAAPTVSEKSSLESQSQPPQPSSSSNTSSIPSTSSSSGTTSLNVSQQQQQQGYMPQGESAAFANPLSIFRDTPTRSMFDDEDDQSRRRDRRERVG